MKIPNTVDTMLLNFNQLQWQMVLKFYNQISTRHFSRFLMVMKYHNNIFVEQVTAIRKRWFVMVSRIWTMEQMKQTVQIGHVQMVIKNVLIT